MADLKSIYKKLSPKPLEGPESERWYIDAVAGRGDDPVWKLTRRVQDEGYNGDWWCDVYPIVRTILEERKQN